MPRNLRYSAIYRARARAPATRPKAAAGRTATPALPVGMAVLEVPLALAEPEALVPVEVPVAVPAETVPVEVPVVVMVMEPEVYSPVVVMVVMEALSEVAEEEEVSVEEAEEEEEEEEELWAEPVMLNC